MDEPLITQRIADRLDGLLDGAEAEEADRLIALHPDLHARVQRLRAVLYEPWTVAPPRRRAVAPLVRYAAAFAAGALLVLLVQSRGQSPAPESQVEPEPAPAPVLVVENRRIT